MKHFLFVSGDIGGANAQAPIAHYLQNSGHIVTILADGSGRGIDVWSREKLNYYVVNDLVKFDLSRIFNRVDLAFINTCASASELSTEMTRILYGKTKVVLGADGLFNHGFEKYRQAQADYWFALNEEHAQAIRGLRPNLPPECVVVVGQPAFDRAIELIPNKEKIRAKYRASLSISDQDKVVLWWATGMANIIEEDIEMLLAVLEYLSGTRSIFIPRIHPKLENIKKGYVKEIRERIQKYCDRYQILVILADQYPGEELCLSSDLIISITCTEDIKNVLMGGPPVIHLLGPTTRRWMESDLYLRPPYLPDIRSGQSLGIFTREEAGEIVDKALSLEFRHEILTKWIPPKEKSVDKTVRLLRNLAQGHVPQ